jgi:DNA-directed RNA polymerase subunit RPC12/RpoP
MKGPTDEEIFNHMKPDDEIYCGKCGNDVETVEYDDYITHKCLSCGHEPGMPEEL